jgi:transposase-like protein
VLFGGDVAKATCFGRLVKRMLVAYTGVRRHQNLYTKCRELFGRDSTNSGSVTIIGRCVNRIEK